MSRDLGGSDGVSIKVLATKFSIGFALSQVNSKLLSTFVNRITVHAKQHAMEYNKQVLSRVLK